MFDTGSELYALLALAQSSMVVVWAFKFVWVPILSCLILTALWERFFD